MIKVFSSKHLCSAVFLITFCFACSKTEDPSLSEEDTAVAEVYKKIYGASIYLSKLGKFGVEDPKLKKFVDFATLKAKKTVVKAGLNAAAGAAATAGSIPTPASPAILLAASLFGITVPVYESIRKIGKWAGLFDSPRESQVKDLFQLVKRNDESAVQLCKELYFNEKEWKEIIDMLQLFDSDVERAEKDFMSRVMAKTK
uniref:hypothetical protein n=1 Tax=Algoriphagus sp. TaxID=1872435 RepID=UPI00404877C0